MTKLVAIKRSAGVLGVLAICTAMAGCVTQSDFDTAMIKMNTSISQANQKAADNEASIADASSKLNDANKQIVALEAKLVELEKLKDLASRISTAEGTVTKLSTKVEEIRSDITSTNTQVATLTSKVKDQATVASMDSLRADMKLKDDALEKKDIELAKISADTNAVQDGNISKLEEAKIYIIDELKTVKQFGDVLNDEMKTYKGWTINAVGNHDRVIASNTENLKQAFQSIAQALEKQLAEIKKIAAAIVVPEPTATMPDKK